MESGRLIHGILSFSVGDWVTLDKWVGSASSNTTLYSEGRHIALRALLRPIAHRACLAVRKVIKVSKGRTGKEHKKNQSFRF